MPEQSSPRFLLDKCCCCIELRTGCLVIGYINLVCDILLIILGLVALVGGTVVAVNAEKDEEQTLGAGVLAFSIILLIIAVLLLAFTIVLLVGLHQNKRGHVKAYLIYAAIFIVISIIGFFASFAGHVTAGEVIKNLLTIALSIYFVLVIRSYYYKMDEKRPAVYSAA